MANAVEKQADNDVGWAMDRMAEMHELGEHGLVVDKPKALQLHRRTADQGFACSMSKLGAEGSNSQSCPEAHQWSKAAADKGDVEAQRLLGTMCHNGDGVAEDKAEAVRLFTLSTSQDPNINDIRTIDASFFLGVAFFDGSGGPEKSPERAKFYLPKAAQANKTARPQDKTACAQNHLAVALLESCKKRHDG